MSRKSMIIHLRLHRGTPLFTLPRCFRRAVPRAEPALLGLLLVLPGARSAEPEPQTPPVAAKEAKETLTLARLFKGEFNAAGYSAKWAREGARYLRFEPAKPGPGRDLVAHDAATGAREVLVPGPWLIPPGRETPLSVEAYAFSRDGQRVLMFTNSRRVWRQRTRGDYWLLDRTSRALVKLGGDAPEASLMFATFSPDGKKVAYVRERDLYVQDTDTLAITRLTRDGGPHLINGTFDWVYEEELSLRKGFQWSPDSARLAFWQIDTTRVPEFLMLDNTSGLYPRLIRFAYPKAGETNPAARVGVVSVEGGPVTWIKLPGDPRRHYPARVHWLENPLELVIQQLNRLQNTNQLFFANPETGDVRPFFAETDAAWVDVRDDALWRAGDRQLLWLSERDGWRRGYAVDRRTGRAKKLTKGDWDVIQLLAVDEAAECCYLLASPDSAVARYLYRVPLKGRKKARRLTPDDQPGWHDYRISPDRHWAIHTWSRLNQPPLVELIDLPGHTRKRLLEDNQKLRGKLARLAPVTTEFFRVDIGEDVMLDGWCLKPPHFDPARKYPVLFHVYGEPGGQTVLDRWGGFNGMWHRMLAERGYVVMSLDNRGTPAPRGRAWRKCIYRQIGVLASRDQARGLDALKARWPWMDGERIGIWGWSGGGSMTLNALFRHPDRYQLGMAVAPVPNLRFYDTIYQERYMGLPSDNAEGYLKGSPITFAHQLEGDLLLVHGTGDDNVHYQGTEQLINDLVTHDKPFTLMAYPNRTHSIREGPNTRRHLFELLTRYLETHLPAGAQP
jgi:dipeptidyl-peptidase-4